MRALPTPGRGMIPLHPAHFLTVCPLHPVMLRAVCRKTSFLSVKAANLAPSVLAVLSLMCCGTRNVGSAHTRQGDDPPAPCAFLTACPLHPVMQRAVCRKTSFLSVKAANLAPSVLAVLSLMCCGTRNAGSAHTRQGDDPPAPCAFFDSLPSASGHAEGSFYAGAVILSSSQGW